MSIANIATTSTPIVTANDGSPSFHSKSPLVVVCVVVVVTGMMLVELNEIIVVLSTIEGTVTVDEVKIMFVVVLFTVTIFVNK